MVGRFGRTHGVSGEIYINPLTDNPERFRRGGTFWVEAGAGWKPLVITPVYFTSGKPVVRVEGVESGEDARELTNQYLYIERNDLGELPNGIYYHFDLIGCHVIGVDNTRYGKVIEVERYPANDVMVVEADDKKRYLCPMVKDFVREIDIAKRKIIVTPLPGIFETSDET